MRLWLNFPGLALCILLVGCERHEAGRFQLLQCEIDTSQDGIRVPHKALFKIDTLTGQTWELVQSSGTNSFIGWIPLRDYETARQSK